MMEPHRPIFSHELWMSERKDLAKWARAVHSSYDVDRLNEAWRLWRHNFEFAHTRGWPVARVYLSHCDLIEKRIDFLNRLNMVLAPNWFWEELREKRKAREIS